MKQIHLHLDYLLTQCEIRDEHSSNQNFRTIKLILNSSHFLYSVFPVLKKTPNNNNKQPQQQHEQEEEEEQQQQP